MRCISLWQPWATAIALGFKTIETRHWSTDYRGRLAIHAAKRWTREEREFAAQDPRLPKVPPLGAIVATAMLVDVRFTHHLCADRKVSDDNARYGNYQHGRFGWVLENIVALAEPVTIAGRQGFFDVPDELLPAHALQHAQALPHCPPVFELDGGSR